MSGPASLAQAAVDRNDVELAHEVLAALTGEEDALAVRSPVEHHVVG